MPEMEISSWRKILASLCETQQKQTIANAVGCISVRTIDRWISGQSSPQKDVFIRNLGRLSEEMQQALQQEFPEAFLPEQEAPFARITIPTEFHRRVEHAYAHVPPSSKRWTIWNLVSYQILPHLDPTRTGLVVLYARMDYRQPEPTLLLEESSGNLLWTTRQVAQKATCTDHWLIQIVARGRPLFIQSCSLAHISPPSCILHHDLIQSIGFFPLYRAGQSGGGIVFCSTEEDFFTPIRQELIEEYSYLFALMLNDSDFSQREFSEI